jgi:molybdopterin molybdotransferase
LTVIGQAAAGHAFDGSVGPGEAVRIFTGAPVPAGANTIVIQEDTSRDGDRVTAKVSSKSGEWIRPKGFDFAQGDVLLTAGRRLGARDLALAAAMNVASLPVRRRPRVAILATGDELVMPGDTPAPDQIISSIPYALMPLILAAGGQPERLGIARDTLDDLARHIARAREADILLTIGGASVGDHDLVQGALKAEGLALDFWQIAMRPGKPLMYGRLGRQRVLGVPGNPVSAILCSRIFLVPMLRRLLGIVGAPEDTRQGVLAGEVPENGPRQHYMRATLSQGANGEVEVTPARSQDSSLLTPLAHADCLIVRPPRAPAAKAGERVPVLTLDF